MVYLDPPYDSDLYEPLLEALGRPGSALAEDGVVVAEHFHKRALPERMGALSRVRHKRVGDHCLSFYRRRDGGGDPRGGGSGDETEGTGGAERARRTGATDEEEAS